MNAKTMLLIAFGLAVALPYITVALLEGGGTIGTAVIAGIFVAALFLVVLSDRRGDDESRLENT